MLNVDSLNQYSHSKILTIDEAAKSIASARAAGKKVGMCHGGFDLMHPGHVKHFESAKSLCDILCVSVTSDRFVADRKGLGRPIFTDKLRAYMIANLSVVDFVVISDFKKGVEVINALKPTYYIKGPDMIGKTTPGIIAEREAIKAVGGEDKYTNDPPSSTTAIIEYIKKEVKDVKLLVVLDRDGTLIEDTGFVGQGEDWQEKIKMNKPVIDVLSFLKTKYRSTFVVVSNQAGIARGLYDHVRWQAINEMIAEKIKPQGVTIASWQCAPDVDTEYAKAHPEVSWDPKHVKKETTRKPSTMLVTEALMEAKKELNGFTGVLVFGDRSEDEELAKNLKAGFIDVKGKSYDQMRSMVDMFAVSVAAGV